MTTACTPTTSTGNAGPLVYHRRVPVSLATHSLPTLQPRILMTRISCLAGGLLASFLLALPLAAQTVTLTATDTDCIDPSGTNWNDNRLRAYWSGRNVDGFMKFDLSAIPDGATFVSMKLTTFHEYDFGNPYNDPEVQIHRVANDTWSRPAVDPHPGLNEVLTPVHSGAFPTADLVPYTWNLDVLAANWSVDLADDTLSLGMTNVAGLVGRYSYVYWYGSDTSPAPPALEITFTSGPSLAVRNLVAGGTASLEVSGATPGGPVFIAYSLSGGGPTTVPVGPCGLLTAELSPPFSVLPPQAADPGGFMTLLVNVPGGAVGRTVWFQGLDLASCTLTNGVMAVVG